MAGGIVHRRTRDFDQLTHLGKGRRLRFLVSDGVDVPVPMPAEDGSPVVSTSWAGIPGEWHGVVFERCEKRLSEDLALIG